MVCPAIVDLGYIFDPVASVWRFAPTDVPGSNRKTSNQTRCSNDIFLFCQQFFTRGQFCQITCMILAGKDRDLRIDIPPPAIVKPMALWTGKQVVSVMLRPNKHCNIKINLRTKGESMAMNCSVY